MGFSFTEFLLILAVAAFQLAVLFGIVYLAVRLVLRRQRPSPEAPKPSANEIPPTESPSNAMASPGQPVAPSLDVPIKRAFDFDEDKVTIILEMPAVMLDHDEALAEGWVQVMDEARRAYQQVLEGEMPPPQAEKVIADAAPREAIAPNDLRGEHLEASLNRLKEAAERRRRLRMMLHEKQTA